MEIPDHLLESIDTLEPLPATSRRLLEILDEEDVSVADVVEILEHDQAVTANVLRVANSAGMSGRYRVDNLRTAAVRLGIDQLLEVCVGIHLRSLSCDAGMYAFDENELWLHSAVTAAAAREIAQLHADRDFPKSTATAALVHDIGKLVMLRAPEADIAVLRSCWDNADGKSFVEFERECFGCDHAAVGAALAERWSFPAEIAEVISRHHECSAESSTPMLDVVKAANLVSKTVGVGLGAQGLNVDLDSGAFERLALDEDAFSLVCAETAVRVADLRGQVEAG